MTKTIDYSKGFSVGIANLKYGQVNACKERLKEVLDITTRQSIDNYIRGNTTITKGKAIVIETVFKEFGISNPKEIWGESDLPRERVQTSILRRAKIV